MVKVTARNRAGFQSAEYEFEWRLKPALPCYSFSAILLYQGYGRAACYTHRATFWRLSINIGEPMKIQAILLLAAALALSACDNDKPKTAPAQESSGRTDNPLLKLQDETVNKAKEKIEAGVANTQHLDAADKQ